MPVPLPTSSSPPPPSTTTTDSALSNTPYPATTVTATATISGVPTTATGITFSDRILITIVQNGRLAQWLQVPLDASDPISDDPYMTSTANSMSAEDPDGLLPNSMFTPKSLLGGAAGTEREVVGHLLASQIASAIKVKDGREKRTLVLGLGLMMGREGGMERGVWEEVMGLVLGVI